MIEAQVPIGMVCSHDQSRVRPVDLVAWTVDEIDYGANGSVEIGNTTNRSREIVTVIGPVDVALLDEQEETVGIARQHLERSNARLRQSRILEGSRLHARTTRTVERD